MAAVRALALLLLAGCHSTLHYTDTRQGEVRRVQRPDAPRPLAPAVMVTEAGRLRFVEPLVCRFDTVTDLASFDVEETRANPAALIVGIVATSLGVVAGITGLSADEPADSPLTWAGAVGVAGGVPLVIGPLIGRGTARNPTGVKELRRPAGDERCGERPVAAARARLTWSGLSATGAVDADGTFAISPFDFVDAFDVGRLPALAIAVELERDGGPVALEAVIDAGELARGRDAFFRSRGLDGTVIPIAQMTKVPQLETGYLAVALAPGPALRVSLPLDNVGPGDAYGVRLLVGSSSPEVDGRIIYLGRVAAHAHAVFDAMIPLTAAGAAEVASGDATFSALVRDAHDVSPTTPVRFRGQVLRTGP